MDFRKLRYIVLFATLITGFEGIGQEGSLMFSSYPPNTYQSSAYTSSPQNLDIIQSRLGMVYMANASGILEHDGKTWRMISVPDGAVIYRFALDASNRILALGNEEIGLLGNNEEGETEYVSLKSQFETEWGAVGLLSKAVRWNDRIYFISDKTLYTWNGRNFFKAAEQDDFVNLHLTGDQLIVNREAGLFQLSESGMELFADAKDLPEDAVVGISKADASWILLTAYGKSYRLDEQGGVPERIPTDLDSYLQDTRIYAYKKLRNGDLALGTLGKGLVIADPGMQVLNVLNRDLGLFDNDVIAIFEDGDNKLWLGSSRGYSITEYPSAISIYDESRGLTSIVTSIAKGEKLYAGTSDGLFELENKGLPGFKKIWDGSVFDLQEADGDILIAHNAGISVLLPDGRVKEISDLSSRRIISKKGSTSRFVGYDDGVAVINKQSGNWKLVNEIPLGAIITTLAWLDDEVLIACSDQIYEVQFGNGFTSVPEVKIWDQSRGVNPDWKLVEVSFLEGVGLVFGTSNGLFTLDAQTGNLVSSELLGTKFTKDEEIVNIVQGPSGRIWFTSSLVNGFVDPASPQEWHTEDLRNLPNIQTWKIYPEVDNATWLCTTFGLYRYDEQYLSNRQNKFQAFIRTASNSRDSLTFKGFFPNGNDSLLIQTKEQIPEFPYSHNDISFTVAASSYNINEELQYAYKLDPLDKSWSAWSTERVKEYSYLPEGSYTFSVRAKNRYDVISEEAGYSFVILKPWYKTGLAYLLYACVIGLFIYLGYYLTRKRIEAKQQEEIRLKQQEIERERQVSRELRKVDQLKDEYLAQTSHELKTPLTGIIGIAESLRDGIAGDTNSRMSSNLSLIIDSGKRLEGLVNSILDYSKLKTKNIELQRKPVGLRSITEVVIRILQYQLGTKPVEIRNEIKYGLPAVFADEVRLEQILFNLIGNAIKFTDEGEIVVDAEVKGDMMFISIRDTGIGIEADRLEEIFDSYEQINLDSDRTRAGTGLGLTISKQLTELHGGTIEVESAPGTGSTFTFSLPVTEVQAVAEVARETHQLVPQGIAVGQVEIGAEYLAHILIVDDEAINRSVLTNQLELHGYRTTTAENGNDAIDMIRSGGNFDLVLLDLMMPSISGFEVCEEIRKTHLPNDLPIILLTAKNEIADLVQGFSHGANDYITKPFSKDELIARVKMHLKLLRINSSYRRFLPQEFFRYLKKDNILDIKLGDQVQRTVTMLFCDIRQYTSLAETMSPQENFDFLNAYHERIGPIIRNHNGFINQYVGDGILALFLESAKDAVKASVEMQKAISLYNESRKLQERDPIKVGIGIHTGSLIMGILGDVERMDAGVVADSVNTASRMEGLTKFYGSDILISEDTYNELQGEFSDCRYLAKVQVKGRQKAVKVYEVLQEQGNSGDSFKLKSKSDFEEGLRLYFKKDFTKSVALFNKILELNPSDKAARHYLTNCASLMVDGVSQDWTGVEFMTTK